MFQLGEFSKSTPSNNTFLQSTRLTMTGRRKSLMDNQSASDEKDCRSAVSPFRALTEGYHRPASLSTPPDCTTCFQCPSETFIFFKGRQASPEPLITPSPVIATFAKFFPVIGHWQRLLSLPSKTAVTKG